MVVYGASSASPSSHLAVSRIIFLRLSLALLNTICLVLFGDSSFGGFFLFDFLECYIIAMYYTFLRL